MESLDQIAVRFLLDDTAADDVFRDALEADRRAAQLSPAYRAYYQLRPLIPLAIRQLLQRHRRVEASNRWCHADRFFRTLLERLAAAGPTTIIHPWPDGARFAFVLTHDVETADGVKRIAEIADLEQELGFRSSWNFVPHKYRIDDGLLTDLHDRGFEIGVHGYNHDGRLFVSRSVFQRRVPAINAAMERFSAVGFRAPMVHRNLEWLQQLEIQYDASYFDADPYQAMPGGVGGVWPFIAGRFVELPYTLPQDHTLLVALGHTDGRLWHEKLDYLARLGGMSLVITHPDYLDTPDRLDIYRGLLEYANELHGMWHTLPRDVASWWRLRDRSTIERDADNACRIVGPATERARLTVMRPRTSDDATQDALHNAEPFAPVEFLDPTEVVAVATAWNE